VNGGERVATLDDVITALTGHVRVALAGTDAGAPARVCDVPGLLAWDGCDCGLLAVTVDRLYPAAVFPTEAVAGSLTGPCPPPYEVADLTVTVLRCAPGPDRRGNPPSCTALDAAALTWFRDLDAVRGAVAAALIGLRETDVVADFTLRDTVPAGPDGGCVGLDTHLSVGMLCVGAGV
jgi:hypothetical protein